MADGEADGFNERGNNKKVSPLELLLEGSLRYLGRGWTFDDIEKATTISRDVHRCSFHVFTRFGAKICTRASYKYRRLLPTCKIASPSMPRQDDFLDVSAVPMRRTSHWTR